jgi:hypothetical protein
MQARLRRIYRLLGNAAFSTLRLQAIGGLSLFSQPVYAQTRNWTSDALYSDRYNYPYGVAPDH